MRHLILIAAIVFSRNVLSQTNINISNYPFHDTEPCIAINPADSQKLVAAWMRVTGILQVSIATSYSTDGGITWSTPIVIPHIYPNFTHADPSLVFNFSGSLVFLCYIDYSVNKDTGFVMVSKSATGGQTWNAPVIAISDTESPDLPVDRPWIAMDRSGGPYDGRLYVVSKSVDIGTLPHHVWMKSSSDSGMTWSNLKLIDDSIATSLITNSMGVPAVSADGTLYIAYASWDLNASPLPRIIASKSADGGNTFIPYIIENLVSGSAITDTLYQPSYCLSANPQNPSNLVFISTDARFGDPDILSVHSDDAGISWLANPVRVNDDAVNNGIGQDMCWGAFSQSGIYVCAWRDRRNGGTGSSAPFEVFVSASTDGGASFSFNKNMSSAQSPAINLTKGNDFLGVCAGSAYVFSDWSDLRTGNTEIFVSRIPMNTIMGIETGKEDFGIEIYPNPANERIEIRFPGKNYCENSTLMIYDAFGRVRMEALISKGKSLIVFSVKNVDPGIYYYMVITCQEKLYSGKVAVIR